MDATEKSYFGRGKLFTLRGELVSAISRRTLFLPGYGIVATSLTNMLGLGKWTLAPGVPTLVPANLVRGATKVKSGGRNCLVWCPETAFELLDDTEMVTENLAVCHMTPGLVVVGPKFEQQSIIDFVETEAWLFNPMRKTWRALAVVRAANRILSVVRLGEKLLAVGSDTRVFDSKSNQWTHVTNIRCFGNGRGVVACEEELFLAGGFREDHFGHYDCSAVNLATGLWTKKPALNHERAHHALIALDDNIYALGGSFSVSILDSVERYDRNANRWELRAPMQQARASFGVAVVGHSIYVIGGTQEALRQRHTATCERYDADTNTWTSIAPLIEPCAKPVASTFNNTIFVFGGRHVRKYDVQQDTWEVVREMPTSFTAQSGARLDP